MFKRRNDGTFRAKKKFDEGTVRQRLHIQAKNTLKRGIDLRQSVKLPEGEDKNEWCAVHVVDFYNRISLLYDTISSYCTETTCPVMSGGPRYQYHWQDNKEYKKPTLLSAPKYIHLLMDWIEEIINDENIFPQDAGSPFPKNFVPICKKIFSRLYRVFVHVYIHHFDAIKELQAEAHVNQCYKHYYFFCLEFHLIEPKELKPLEALNQAFSSS